MHLDFRVKPENNKKDTFGTSQACRKAGKFLQKPHRKMRKHNHSGGHPQIFRHADKNIRRGKFPCVLPEKIDVKLAVDNAENPERENQNPQNLKNDKLCRDFSFLD